MTTHNRLLHTNKPLMLLLALTLSLMNSGLSHHAVQP